MSHFIVIHFKFKKESNVYCKARFNFIYLALPLLSRHYIWVILNSEESSAYDSVI